MVEMLQVQIKDPGIALSVRERKLIEGLVIHVCVHHLHRRVGKPFRIRPAQVDSIHLIVNQDVIVDGGMTVAEAKLVMQDLERDIHQSLELCELETEAVIVRTSTSPVCGQVHTC